MAVVVADAGPLIALARVDALDLLRELFRRILVPEAVRAECCAKPGPDADRITAAIARKWLVVTPVTLPHAPAAQLGKGERQALALAQAHPSALLLVDDRLARREAARLGLSFIGTVRVLWVAEQRGLIPSAERIVGQMRANGYRISVDLLEVIRGGQRKAVALPRQENHSGESFINLFPLWYRIPCSHVLGSNRARLAGNAVALTR